MTTPRTTTVIAILGGAALGALTALWSTDRSSAPKPEPLASVPFRPVSQPPPESSVPSAAGATAATTAPDGDSIGPDEANPTDHVDPVGQAIDALRKDPQAVRDAEVHCARGDPEDCLLVGDLYAHDEDPDRVKRSKIYRRRAIVLYAERCRERWPVACHVLSRMYEKGIGVAPNPETAEALLHRSLELCEQHPDRPCVAEGAEVPPTAR